jgi:hypothetical protein
MLVAVVVQIILMVAQLVLVVLVEEDLLVDHRQEQELLELLTLAVAVVLQDMVQVILVLVVQEL